MNLLIHRLPDKDKYGKPIRTDFRHWINFQNIMQDADLSEEEKTLLAIKAVYVLDGENSEKIDYLKERLDGAMCFLNGWQTQINNTASTGQKVFDFNIDAPQIYASFLQQYGIKLTRDSLHWYEFMSLLVNLSQETPMGYIMHIRGCKVEGTKEQKAFIQQQKNLYRLDFIEYNPKELVKRYSKKQKEG